MLDAARNDNLHLQETLDRLQRENKIRVDVAALDSVEDSSTSELINGR